MLYYDFVIRAMTQESHERQTKMFVAINRMIPKAYAVANGKDLETVKKIDKDVNENFCEALNTLRRYERELQEIIHRNS